MLHTLARDACMHEEKSIFLMLSLELDKKRLDVSVVNIKKTKPGILSHKPEEIKELRRFKSFFVFFKSDHNE